MSSFSLMREDRMRENIDRTMGESGISVYDLAEEFVENTDCSVFLTGKAGTGKTTFLRRIKESTRKQAVVVAPTGVAAINAGGTTIHSFFQIPPAPYVPSMSENANFFAKQKVSAVRRKLFRQLELLIIDEISMVRADLLDLIDLILRHYRYRPKEPFGGVQVIFIGDMYQLAPVCTAEDWEMLRHFYRSPYFFHSRVLEARQPVYIELDHIFRQTNRLFIDLLNEVRNGHLSPMSVSLLEKRYNPNFSREEAEGYITLTTHNANADRINHEALDRLGGKVSEYEAEVKGDFPEKSYPADSLLQLKRGAKVMFIANDKENPRRYFNGKIGTVTDMDEESVTVECDEGGEPITVGRETWNNVQYRLDRETNAIEETVLGTYSQIPLRLAWAITIHKSQGLTFDRVIIDAGAAFASGQVYVALSRCRTLDGIVFTTPINPDSLSVSSHIIDYSSSRLPVGELEKIAEAMKRQYNLQILIRLFGMDDMMESVRDFTDAFMRLSSDFTGGAEEYLEKLRGCAMDIYTVAQKFIIQLDTLAQSRSPRLGERIAAASAYFTERLGEMLSLFASSPLMTDSRAEADEYTEQLKALHETVAQREWIIDGIKEDYSVSNYFAVKASFRTPDFTVKAYSGDNVRTLIRTEHPALYKLLAAKRNEICEERSLPVYMVASTKMLAEMADALPVTAEELMKIKGFGRVKAKSYGQDFIDIIKGYCDENGIVPQERVMPFSPETNGDTEDKDKPKREKRRKGKSLEESLELFRRGMSVDEVAAAKGLARSTIMGHLLKLVRSGEVQARDHVAEEKYHAAQEALAESGDTASLSSVYEALGGSLTYDELRLVRAQMEADGVFG